MPLASKTYDPPFAAPKGAPGHAQRADPFVCRGGCQSVQRGDPRARMKRLSSSSSSSSSSSPPPPPSSTLYAPSAHAHTGTHTHTHSIHSSNGSLHHTPHAHILLCCCCCTLLILEHSARALSYRNASFVVQVQAKPRTRRKQQKTRTKEKTRCCVLKSLLSPFSYGRTPPSSSVRSRMCSMARGGEEDGGTFGV